MFTLARQPYLLAQTLPAEPGNIVLTLGLIAIVVTIAAGLVGIWHMNKRQPPIETLVEKEVGKVEKRMEERLTRIEAKLDQIPSDKRLSRLEETVARLPDEQAHKRGIIYKHFESEIKDVYRRVEESQNETRQLITALTATVNKSFQDIQRDIGRIETRNNKSS